MDARTRIIPFLYPIFTAVVMVILVRSGLLTPLFLIPLGLLGQRHNKIEVVRTALLMIFINMVLTFIAVRSEPAVWKLFLADTLYVSALTLLFVFFLIPGMFKGILPFIRGTYRILIASFVGMLFLLPVFIFVINDQDFYSLVKQQADNLADLLKQNTTRDVVQQSVIEHSINADTLIAIIKGIALRGGLFIGHVVFFGISTAVSRQNTGNRWYVRYFHVDFVWIWIFSVMLLGILAGNVFKIPFLEILGWNGALTAMLLYFLQGIGILSYLMVHLPFTRGNRIVFRVLFILVMFSPGINAIVLAGITLLGIAENWIPLRRSHLNGPSSTPGM